MDGGLGRWFRTASLAEQLRAADVREDLVQAAGRTAFGRQSHRGIADLSSVLDDDEVVLQLLEGRHGKAVGLLVATTRRIVFAAKAARGTPAVIIDRADVLSVAGRSYRGLGVLTLTTASGDIVVDQILGTQAETFADTVLHARSAPLPGRSSTDRAGSSDPLTELAELRALHEAGVIADAEFQVRKRRLFDQI